MASIFSLALRDRALSEPSEASIKQFGDYRQYPYKKMLPRSSPVCGRNTTASAFPIRRWAELPYAVGT